MFGRREGDLVNGRSPLDWKWLELEGPLDLLVEKTLDLGIFFDGGRREIEGN